tara:strand:- start:1209 stop:1451 length:243 start_codon:yes stop_codon:yes gene_type:complete
MFVRFSLLTVVPIRLATSDTKGIIEFAHALPPSGMDHLDPAVEGARSRGIVMIARALISGVMPLATPVGAGAARRPGSRN